MGFERFNPNAQPSGQFMSGGFFSKAIDLLGAGGYMSAGAADALLSGRNPLEGAREGLMNRASYIDVMRKRGVPNIAAVPLGLAGDILLDPSNLLLGGAIKLSKAGAIAELGQAATELAGRGVRTAAEVAAATGDIGHLEDAAHAASTLQYGRGKAAHAAYQGALAGGEAAARRAARTAAKNFDPDPATLAALGQEMLASTKFGPISPSQGPAWLRGLKYLKTKLAYTVEDMVSKDPQTFGTIGPEFAQKGLQQENIRQALGAENTRHISRILRLVGKNKQDQLMFYKAVHGLEDAGNLSPKLYEAHQMWQNLAHTRYMDMKAAGMKQVHTAMTIAFNRKSQEAQDQIAKLLKAGTIEAGAKYELGTPEWFAQKIAELGGEVSDSGAVHIPIMERAHYGPLYSKGQAISAQRAQVDYQNLVKDIEDQLIAIGDDPKLSAPEARRLAEEKAMDIFMAPNDIRRQFQYGRLADNIPVNPRAVEMNPHIWMAKWGNDTADRLSQALVWGGEDQVFKQMKESLRLQGDRVPGFTGHEQLQKVFDLLTGQAKQPLRPIMSALSQASNIFFLGPRTTILQATQLANNMSWHGISSGFAGVIETLTNPELRQLSEEIGATLPTLYHAADEGSLSHVVQFWHKAMGIEQADRLVRTAGAIGSGIHGIETGKNLAAAVASKNQGLIAKYSRIFEMHGLDPKAIIEAGGKLTTDQKYAFMMRGANISNYTNSIMSLPSVFREPGGQFFLKFKNYAFQQSGFINRLIQRAKNGDWEPAIKYAAMFPWTYGVVFRAMNTLRAKPIDTEDDWAMLQNMMMTGALGFWGDSAMALGSPSEALRLGVFAGPNAKMIGTTISSLGQAVTGAPEAITNNLIPQGARQLRTLYTGEQE